MRIVLLLCGCAALGAILAAESFADRKLGPTVAAGVHSAGQDGEEPVPAPAAAAVVDAQTVRRLYLKSCRVCHASGAAGAHRTGNASAWAPALEKGMPALLRSVQQGQGGMPPGGMCPTCSAAELRALIDFMSGTR